MYILDIFYFAADENGSISETIPDRPVELKNFPKLCEQRRKFPVLYKLEFQVRLCFIIR